MGNEDREDICKKLNNNQPSTNELSSGNSGKEDKLCQPNQVDVYKKACLPSGQVSSYNFLSFLYFNATSIVNKIDHLKVILESNDYNVICITETWLKSFHCDSFITGTQQFNIIRNDRLCEKGGGVCVLYHKDLTSKVLPVAIDSGSCIGFEILAFDIFSTKNNRTRFVCVYLPPSSAKSLAVVHNLLNVISGLHTVPTFHILGDFNFSYINWEKPFLSSQSKPFKAFKNYLDSTDLTQLITFPTHRHGNTLDLFITSRVNNILSIDQREPFTKTCDHNMIEVRIEMPTIKIPKPPTKRNFFRGNYEKINEFLSKSDWAVLLLGKDDINVAYSKFTEIIHNSIDKFVPIFRSNKKISLPPNIKLLRKTKSLLYPIVKTDAAAKTIYKELDKTYRKAVVQFTYRKEQRILRSNNKKMFYGYITVHPRLYSTFGTTLPEKSGNITKMEYKRGFPIFFHCSHFLNYISCK